MSAELRARLVKYGSLAFVAYCLAVLALGARAQPGPTLADLKKLMPKDQKALVEKVEEYESLRVQAQNLTGLRQSEVSEKYRAMQKELKADLKAKLDKGFKDWVGDVSEVGAHEIAIAIPDRLTLVIAYEGLPDKTRGVIRDLRVGDRVVVTVGQVARPVVDARDGKVGAEVPGPALKAIDKKGRD